MPQTPSYQVTIQPSGHTFSVKENEFILDAALRQEIAFPHGCRTGSCGTCLGKVISGDIHYPDGLPLTVMEHEHESGKAVFCVSIAKSDLHLEVKEVDESAGFKPQVLPARVTSLEKLSSDVMQLQLKLPESKSFDFHAGQYIEFILRDKSRRAFSLASGSDDEFVELHIRHVDGGVFTTHIFEEMKEKAIVRFEGPFGSFHIGDKSNRPLILIAGGTGFAPIKGMIEKLIKEGDTRLIHLYWGVRAEDDLYLNDLAKGWAKKENITYVPVLSDSSDHSWEGRKGFVHEAVIEDFSDLSGFDVYTAGPPPMVNAIKTAFAKQGLPEEQLFSDSFEFTSRS